MGKILVVQAFAAWRLHLCKTTKILAAEVGTIFREGSPVNLVKLSLSRHLEISFWISNSILVQILFFVSECLTYSLSLPIMGF
jgi:hypothetical protein